MEIWSITLMIRSIAFMSILHHLRYGHLRDWGPPPPHPRESTGLSALSRRRIGRSRHGSQRFMPATAPDRNPYFSSMAPAVSWVSLAVSP